MPLLDDDYIKVIKGIKAVFNGGKDLIGIWHNNRYYTVSDAKILIPEILFKVEGAVKESDRV